MERKLDVMPAIKDAIAIGTKNSVSLVLTVLLYVVTVWIPYLNVGTTIAMATIPGKLAKGEVISPSFIFDSVYRRRMGSFFLLEGFLLMMLIPAFLFGIIPGYVLAFMYCLALFIMIDKDVTPTEALELSNKATYGFKWKIFGIILLFSVLLCIVYGIFAAICNAIDVAFITFIVMLAIIIIGVCCEYALYAVIYRNLFLNVQEEAATDAPALEA